MFSNFLEDALTIIASVFFIGFFLSLANASAMVNLIVVAFVLFYIINRLVDVR